MMDTNLLPPASGTLHINFNSSYYTSSQITVSEITVKDSNLAINENHYDNFVVC